MTAYFAIFAIAGAVGFVRAARTSSGVTRRRMQAVAAGSLTLGLVLIPAALQGLQPDFRDFWTAISRVLSLISALAYFVGFAPPRWLRRAWQEPELRAFLARAAELPRLPDTATIVEQLERGAATALGAAGATITLWDPEAQLLRYRREGEDRAIRTDQGIAGKTFREQRPNFTTDATREMPEAAEAYRRANALALLAAPITAGENRLGVLTVYAPRAPIFADDDLDLVRLLADQAAVILESRSLIDEAARVRAREEATRLKDDFLSAVAHDLKTPLTTIIGQAQLLQRRAVANPSAPPNAEGIGLMVAESGRLSELVAELMEALRAEGGTLLGSREPVDLADVVRKATELRCIPSHTCTVDAEKPVVGEYDAIRIRQLVDNLLYNAIKYSPGAGTFTSPLRRPMTMPISR